MLLKRKRIFITEDNIANRSVMQFILENEGATVAFERWGRETCERLNQFAPVDLILLDLMFPDGITGFDVFDAIRATSGFATVPIVAVSAQETDLAIPLAQKKGFNGFLAKPINRRLFAQQINTFLNGGEIWQA